MNELTPEMKRQERKRLEGTVLGAIKSYEKTTGKSVVDIVLTGGNDTESVRVMESA